MRRRFFILSFIFIASFILFSYNVAKENFQQFDFDTMVKIQDRIQKKFDDNFSFFSLIGSVEVTFTVCLLMATLSLLRFKWGSVLGWLIIIPASLIELFGKLVLFHPGPPYFFHRTSLATHLPSFYIHTEFSYPSGHVTRTIFIVTVFICIIFFSKLNLFLKYGLIFMLVGFASLMGLTRISLGEHWLSDVLGGILLGIGSGFFAYLLIHKENVSSVAN